MRFVPPTLILQSTFSCNRLHVCVYSGILSGLIRTSLPSAFAPLCLRVSLAPLLFLQSFADSKHMPIRVPQMHLAHIPRHVCRRKRDVQFGRYTLLVDGIHILDPHRHPSALVRRLVALQSERGHVRSPPATSLPSLAKKNLAVARAHRSKAGRRSPV